MWSDTVVAVCCNKKRKRQEKAKKSFYIKYRQTNAL